MLVRRKNLRRLEVVLAQERNLLAHERGLREGLESSLRQAERRAEDADGLRLALADATARREAAESAVTEAEASALAAKFLHDDLKRRHAENHIDATLGSRVILNTSHDHSMEGILVGSYPDSVVLRHAFYVLGEDGRQDLDGDQVVPRASIEWLQVLSK